MWDWGGTVLLVFSPQSVNQVEPQDKCIGDSCKCPPGMVGVEPFCRPADPEGRTAVEGGRVNEMIWTPLC